MCLDYPLTLWITPQEHVIYLAVSELRHMR
ncbi:MAG: hypothetical protein JWP74_1359 [Marmoricola sp.]|nr:hypothetical protein [Marmoricola sp.]